jgi:hypothetical protein
MACVLLSVGEWHAGLWISRRLQVVQARGGQAPMEEEERFSGARGLQVQVAWVLVEVAEAEGVGIRARPGRMQTSLTSTDMAAAEVAVEAAATVVETMFGRVPTPLVPCSASPLGRLCINAVHGTGKKAAHVARLM